jgi:hypothetical protein
LRRFPPASRHVLFRRTRLVSVATNSKIEAQKHATLLCSRPAFPPLGVQKYVSLSRRKLLVSYSGSGPASFMYVMRTVCMTYNDNIGMSVAQPFRH